MARINLTEMLNHEKETQENRGRGSLLVTSISKRMGEITHS